MSRRCRDWRHILLRKPWRSAAVGAAVVGTVVVGGVVLETTGLGGGGSADAARFPGPTRSTTIALSPDDQFLWVVNREANTVTELQVREKGKDTNIKLAEILVGLEPRCVAVNPDNKEAYVVNGLSGTVSVIPGQESAGGGDDPGGHRTPGLRAHTDGPLPVCGQPHGGHRLHHRHRAADGRGVPCPSVGIPRPSPSPTTATRRTPTSACSSPRSSPSSAPEAAARCAIWGSRGSSTTSWWAIRARSPRPSCPRSPTPASSRTGSASARARTPPTRRRDHADSLSET